ncbi:MAG: hypothetical protein HON90_10545 [Halobacteriovoraceae bacterium]|nr:hypothetical protein [Halobacteriovoraceae bacterium]
MKLIKISFIFSLFLAPFHSCTSIQRMSDNQKDQGHFRLYTYPQKQMINNYDKKRFKRITLVATNNFNGNITPVHHPIPNRFGEKRVLKIGGISATRAYLDVFNEIYGDDFAYIDAGSFLHETNNHAYTLFLYKYLNITASGFGLNEFLINNKRQRNHPKYLQSLTKKIKFPLLASNLFDLKTTEQVRWKNVQNSVIKETSGVKIGYLSVLTQELSNDIPDQNINGIYIQNPAKNIIVRARELRRKGAQIIVLMLNEGVDCTHQLANEENIEIEKVNFFPHDSKHCDMKGTEFDKILKQLPAKTVDVIFTTGEKTKVTNFINKYPVVQNMGQGKYLSWVDLYFDLKHLSVNHTLTKIHQPIQLCHNFLKYSQDCYARELTDDEELVPATLFGKKISIKPLPKF